MPVSSSFIICLWIIFMVSTLFIGKDEIFEIKMFTIQQKKICLYSSLGLFIFIVVSLIIVLNSVNNFLAEMGANSISYSSVAILNDISNIMSILADTQVIAFMLIGVFSVLILKIGKNSLILGFFNILYFYILSLINMFIYSLDYSNANFSYQPLNLFSMFIDAFIFNIVCYSAITLILFLLIRYYRSKKYAYTA